jgi:hypothetical protein
VSPAFAERRWSSADGLSLYARDYAAASGTAKLPVIAIHGLTRNSADFDAIAPLIAQAAGGCWPLTSAAAASQTGTGPDDLSAATYAGTYWP